jgi:predicted transcriptional regulator
MSAQTIALRTDLIQRLRILAERQGQSVDEVVGEMLDTYAPVANAANWAVAVAEGMRAADIDWIDEPDASVNSRAHFRDYLFEKWQRTQQMDDDNG